MRFLHTSDWQLGMTRHFLSGEAQARFAQARLDAIGRLAETARDRGCSFVVVAGDVFETGQPDARTVTRALDQLDRFDVPVYLLPGNHDPYDAASIYRSDGFLQRCPAHVHVLTDPEPRRHVEGVEVVGAPWPNKQPLQDLVAGACEAPAPRGALRVVVGHGGVAEVRGGFDAPGTVDVASVERSIAEGRVHYVALGDRHSCTEVSATGRMWFSGTPEPTSFVEVDPGTALVVDLDTDHVEVERVRVGTWRFHDLEQSVTSDADLDGLEGKLDAIEDPSRVVVRLKLEGTLDLRQAARLDDLVEDRSLRFGALLQPARHCDVAVHAVGDDLAGLRLQGYADVARAALVARSTTEGGGSHVATDALGLLLRLAGQGRAS